MARNELRKTPQNVEAEISVLGCGFLDRTALDKIMDEVSEEMFYDPKNRTIYKAMRTLHQNNIPVDVNTICNELGTLCHCSRYNCCSCCTEYQVKYEIGPVCCSKILQWV